MIPEVASLYVPLIRVMTRFHLLILKQANQSTEQEVYLHE